MDYVGCFVISSRQKSLIEKVEDEDVSYTDYFLIPLSQKSLARKGKRGWETSQG